MSVKDELNRMKEPSSKEKLMSDFNRVTSTMLKTALSKIGNGSMEISDATDLEKIYRIYKDINGIQDTMDGQGSGALPELNAGQEHVIEQRVKVHVNTDTDDKGNIVQKKTIKLEDLAKLSAEETHDMIHEHEKIANNENAKDIL